MIHIDKMLRQYKADVISDISELRVDLIEDAANIIFDAVKAGRCIYIAGNGGSMANAVHFSEDLCSLHDDFKIKVHALCETPMMTAISNDYNYDMVFSKQLQKCMHADDVFIGISCSGNSKNIVNAMRYGKNYGKTIAITGFDGGLIGPMANVHINVNNESFEQCEDIHLAICHMIALSLRNIAESNRGN